MLECELVRKKDKKKRKRPLERDPLLAKKKKVRSKRTNKHSESEISPLNSTVQYDATDFDETLAGDMSTLSTIPPHVDQENVSFDISYDYVPLQSNEPEVNEENETSKQSSVPTSAVKTDKSTQTKYDKYDMRYAEIRYAEITILVPSASFCYKRKAKKRPWNTSNT